MTSKSRVARRISSKRSISARARSSPPRASRAPKPLPDLHALYEASVQGAEYDLDFMERVYRRVNGRRFERFREDFCGTALVAASWVLRRRENRAWGVDLDRDTLEWAQRHRVPRMRQHAKRLELVCADVRKVAAPRVDVIAAYNYSYWVFRERRDLLQYLRAARRGLRPGGLLFLSVFSGSEAQGTLVERKRIAASRSVDGDPVPAFTYVWEQRTFNVIDHHLLCHIHFHLSDGRKIERAFTYDWRMWTLPELRDLLAEAGFRGSLVHIEGWDEARDRPDDVLRRRTQFSNQEGWLGVLIGVA